MKFYDKESLLRVALVVVWFIWIFANLALFAPFFVYANPSYLFFYLIVTVIFLSSNFYITRKQGKPAINVSVIFSVALCLAVFILIFLPMVLSASFRLGDFIRGLFL